MTDDVRFSDAATLVARVLVAGLFLGGAIQKSLAPDAAQALLADWALPVILVWPALLFNAAAGLALILGVWVRTVALALAGYCALTSVFHWVPADPWQMSIFVKNWAIAGGCLALYVAGSGAYRIGGRS